ncbi:MAG: efflux RND transporter periplasmic adaptor subunit [Candidatus Tectomicrobia bacterium]|uniref:Efflux RND transporter periplasmic adaptor subunit n=1 Tax=Tectimicrobiota bacterium TaxID=2528274 RepID=A0A932CM82_UNCTE|nr:efflux RND transporter periplasmic adaptor subunit [Candidatus Tectomicrobia bacterium]
MEIAKRKRIGMVATVLLVVASTLAWRWWGRGADGTLMASGTIEATEVDVSFKIPGRVIERPVDEGNRLEPGALVGRLESREMEAEVDRLRASLQATETGLPQLQTEIAWLEELTRGRIAEARANLAAREARLAELENGSRPQDLQKAWAEVREARALMKNSAADLQRMDTLFREGIIAEQSRDAARTELDVAVERHKAALERLDLVKEGPRQEEIRRAGAEVEQARAALLLAQAGEREVALKRQQRTTLQANIARDRAALAAAEAQLGYTVLRSPQAGVILRKHVEPGEMIAAGTPAVTLADLREIWLKIYIPEPQLGRVRLGQTAEITTDSYPGKVYRGKLTFINSEAEFTPKNVQTQEERVKLVFAVKIAVDNPNQELKPGMPADAKVQLN